jgi:glycosyltransferase involved in cell wall biosynthesis
MTTSFSARNTREKPEIWHVGPGDLTSRIPLILELRRRGYNIVVAGPLDPTIFEDQGIPYHRYSLEPRIRPIADLRSIDELRRLFLEHKPRIVNAFTTKPVLLVPIAAWLSGVRTVVQTITGRGYIASDASFFAWMLRGVYRTIHRFNSRCTSVTVFQNSGDREYFLKAGLVQSGRDRLVPGSGIDVESFLRRRPPESQLQEFRDELDLQGRTVVTMVSRLFRQKGVSEYLQAAAEVRSRRDSPVFLLVGDAGPGWSNGMSSKELVKYSGIVRYLGRRDDIRAILAVTDIFVFPSYYGEGIPRVLLEAGLFGVPIVTTDLPGCREVVRHKWNGLLVSPRNVPALVDAILTLLDSTERRDLMGGRSVAFIRDGFELGKVADSYVAIYEGLLSDS